MAYKCCCCIPARSGLAILDLLTLVYGSLIIVLGVAFWDARYVCETLKEFLDEADPGHHDDFTRFAVDTCEDTIEPFLTAICISLIVVGILALVSALLHYLGLYKKHTGLMIPMIIWLTIVVVNTIFISIAMFVLSALLPSNSYVESIGYFIGGICLLYGAIVGYFLTVFIKYRKHVANKLSRPLLPPTNLSGGQNNINQNNPGQQPSISLHVQPGTVNVMGVPSAPPQQTYGQPMHQNASYVNPAYANSDNSRPIYAQPIYSQPIYSKQTITQPSAPTYRNDIPSPNAPIYQNPGAPYYPRTNQIYPPLQ